MSARKYSLILPCYNASDWIASTVTSIQRQAIAPSEIIVVDDASTDDSVKEVKRCLPKARVIALESNAGPATARNIGIRESQHELIAMVDADDLWPTWKIELQLAAWQRYPDAEVILGFHQQFQEPQIDQEGIPKERCERPHFVFLFGCALYKRSAFDQVGLIDESMRHAEDSDWFLRAWEMGLPMAMVQVPTLFYRRHPGGMTFGKNVQQMGQNRAFKKSIDRRRAGGDGKTVSPLPKCIEMIPTEVVEDILGTEGTWRRFLDELGNAGTATYL